MNKEILPNERIASIKECIDQNAKLIEQADRVKVVLNIKGKSVIPEITFFPEPIKSPEK